MRMSVSAARRVAKMGARTCHGLPGRQSFLCDNSDAPQARRLRRSSRRCRRSTTPLPKRRSRRGGPTANHFPPRLTSQHPIPCLPCRSSSFPSSRVWALRGDNLNALILRPRACTIVYTLARNPTRAPLDPCPHLSILYVAGSSLHHGHGLARAGSASSVLTCLWG
jgi:hypothetical protein